MTIGINLRDGLARLLRRLPYFKGKGRIGNFIVKSLTDNRRLEECLVSFRMRDGSLMKIDLRSQTEKHAYWTGRYDDKIIARLANCLPPGGVAFDVGANVGFYSVPLGRKLRDLRGALYAFEPVGSNYSRLVDVIALNNLGQTVKPLRIALGDRESTVNLSMDAGGCAQTGNAVVLEKNVVGKPTDSARMVRLDDLVVEERIDSCHLIKADIEGGELGMLMGGEEFLRKHSPLIYCELNYIWMGRLGWSFADFSAVSSSLAYKVYREINGTFVQADSSGVAIENVLLVPSAGPMEVHARRHLLTP